MHRSTTSTLLLRLGRWVLAWWMLSLAVATAAPLVQPQAMQVVCTTAGSIKLVATSDDGTATELGAGHLDCALCLPMLAPPPFEASSLPLPSPLAYALQPARAAHIAAATAAPLSARAPPAFLAV
ncbi:hypothetical protein GCM10027082_39210 [Comamonas humi]